jgi:hypothetical protein
MAYQPYDRTPKGIVFFGENAADQVYESTSGFVYTSGTSTLDVPNVNVSNNLDVGGSGTFDGDLTVYGNLNVSGVVNQINLQELLVEDNSITLNSNYSSASEPSSDAFISVNRGPSHSEVDIRWNEGFNYWTFTNDGSNYHPLIIEGSGLKHRFSQSNSDHPILDLDIDDLPIVTSAQDSDYIAIADSSDANATRKITRSNLLAGLGAMSGWTVADESNTQKTIQNNDVVRHSGVGLDVTATGSSSPYLLTFSVNVDDSTLEVHTDDNLRIKDSGISFNHLSDALVIASGEAFSDSDNALMTAAAIADKIEDYGYSTTTGTITEVVGGSGLSPSAGVTSGSVTLDVKVDDLTVGISSDEVYVKDLGIDTAQLASGAVTEAKRERTVGTYNSTSSITHDIALGSGVINLTLPPAASGKMVFVKRTDSATGALTVAASGSQTIDGAGNKALYYQYESINVVSDGNNWFIV